MLVSYWGEGQASHVLHELSVNSSVPQAMKTTGTKKKWLIAGACLLSLMAGWFIANPVGRFGFCRFGLAVYSACPYPLSDLQIRSDGQLRKVDKTHDIRMETLAWLLESKPDVLIVATGWSGTAKVVDDLQALPGVDVHILKTGEAKRLYNQLRKSGSKVAIHYHSTC